jgi:tetratricopeptide (TPR) repeat protein
VLTVAVGAAVYAVNRPEPPRVQSDPAAVSPAPLVLVTAFENRTGEPTLDATLGPTLARALSGSSAFWVVPAARVEETLALMRHRADTPLVTDIAREVARRDGDVVALVTGWVEKVGDLYALKVEARSSVGDSVLAGLSGTPVPRGAIIETLRRLALDLRVRLDASSPLPKPHGPRLARVTTISLRALEFYTQMLALRDGEGLLVGREAEAERLLRLAIGEDREFAAAYMWLAIVVRLEGERRAVSRLEEALTHADRAVALSSEVSRFEQIRAEEQRHLIKFLMNPPEPTATAHAKALIASCEELLQLRPDDQDVLIGCINFYQLTGTPNPDIAIRLAELRPSSAGWQMAAAEAILAAQPEGIERVRHYVQRAARLEPVGWAQTNMVVRARLFSALEIWLAGRPQEALGMADSLRGRMATLPDDERSAYAQQLWSMYMNLGQLDRAEEVLRDLTPWSNRRNAEVIVAVNRGDRTALRELLARHFPKLEDAGGVASAYLEAGLLDESRRLIDAHRRMDATRPGGFSQYLLMLEGHLALLEGRFEEAARPLEQFLTTHGSRPRVGRWQRVKRLQADALTARGALAEAVAVLESASLGRAEVILGQLGGFVDWLRVRDRLAVLYRRTGRQREADTVEAELRTLLAVADDDHPIKRRLTAPATTR